MAILKNGKFFIRKVRFLFICRKEPLNAGFYYAQGMNGAFNLMSGLELHRYTPGLLLY
jgi:hypothetical protein